MAVKIAEAFTPTYTLGLFVVVFFLTYKVLNRKHGKKDKKLLDVPEVDGRAWFFGHGLELQKDMPAFVRSCYQRYGKVFKLKMFRWTIIMVGDRSLLQEYYRAKEDVLSAVETVLDISLFDALNPEVTVENVDHYLHLIRKTIGSQVEVHFPKIQDMAEKFVSSIRKKVQADQDVNLVEECMHFMAMSTAYCVTGIKFTEDQLKKFYEFGKAADRMIMMSFVMPRWMRKLLLQRKVNRLRGEVAEFIYPLIKEYRTNPEKVGSQYIRTAVDMCNRGVYSFTDTEIANACITAIYTAMANSGMGANNSLVDLALHKEHWARLREELSPHVKKGEMGDIVKNSFLHSCIMECARMNPQFFLVMRTPAKNKQVSLGPYYVGDADAVATCGPLLQVMETAEDSYSDPGTFNPERFLRKEGKESSSPPSLNTWGGGMHRCPGKSFALCIIKIALAHFVHHLYFELGENVKPAVDYNVMAVFPQKSLPGVKIRVV